MPRALRSLTVFIAMTAAAVVVVAGVAVATHDAETLHACASKKTGLLRLVASADECLPSETAVQWNTQGPPGAAIACSAGTRYFVGVCIDETARPAASIGSASNDCADEAGRLPTSAEMRAFAAQSGVVIAGAEWSSDLGDHEGTFRYLVFSQTGNGLRAAFDPGPYRCVTAPVQ